MSLIFAQLSRARLLECCGATTSPPTPTSSTCSSGTREATWRPAATTARCSICRRPNHLSASGTGKDACGAATRRPQMMAGYRQAPRRRRRRRAGLAAAARIAAATGARFYCETFRRGCSAAPACPPSMLASFAEAVAAQLDGAKHLVLAGAKLRCRSSPTRASPATRCPTAARCTCWPSAAARPTRWPRWPTRWRPGRLPRWRPGRVRSCPPAP
jgi:hypothetical protein